MKIRGDIIRTYQSIHTWTGIIAGLVLFIGFYAGSLTLFKPAIQQWATPSTQKLQQLELEQLNSLVQQAVKGFDKAKQGFILDFYANSSPMKWYEKGGGRGLRLDDELVHASLNQQGEIVTYQAQENELASLIDQLHRTAGIIGKVGHDDLGVLILGIAAALYFLAIISGVIFLLPTLVKSFFALRTDKSTRRFWLDSHNLVGMISLPFHIIIALSAFVFAFHDPIYDGLSVAYGDKPLFERRASSTQVYDINKLPEIQQYLKKIREVAPDYELERLTFTKLSKANPSLAIELQASDQMMRGGYSDVVYMHPYTMEIEYSSVFNEDSGAYGPIVSSFFSLHFGNYAGTFGRWIYFLLGLSGAFLFYSGNLLWIEKRRVKQPEQKTSCRVIAALTVGVCLGSVLGVVVSMLASKWIYLYLQQANSYYLYCYYSTFFLAIVYCLRRGPAVGAIHVLRALSLTCFAIPLTSLLSLSLTAPGTTQLFNYADYTIDLMALLFAGGFYFCARKTRVRALTGEKNSVWAMNNSRQAEPVSVTELNTATPVNSVVPANYASSTATERSS